MTALEYFCDILQHEMGLDNGQVYIFNQKLMIPTDGKLYIAVSVISEKPFSNTREMVSTTGGGLIEQLSSNVLATLGVNILSRSTEALDRKEEVILALNSIYSQQQQETNGFHIAHVSSGFNNLSEIDGAAIPYRFNITVNVQYKVLKKSAVSYYDRFTKQVVIDPP